MIAIAPLYWKLLLVSWTVFGTACWLDVLPVFGQQLTTVDSRKPEARIGRTFEDQQLQRRLRELEAWCNEQGLSAEAEIVRGDLIERDPGRHYLFLPDDSAVQLAATSDRNQEWRNKWLEIRRDYAEKLFQLAKKASANRQATEAYQWLHEVLHWDPEHAATRSVLNHRNVDGEWQARLERLRVRPAAKIHPVFKWPAASYLVVTTENFEVFSQADEATTVRLVESLQRWHEVWRQMFFEYWCTPPQLENWFEGVQRARSSTRKYQVTFFADRAGYLQALEPLVPGVGISSGYYDEKYKMAFYYNSDDPAIGETWCHELVHQLFQEAPGTKVRPFEKGFLWLCEGIAMYLESLRDYGAFVTVGGWDATRLQFARLRRFRDGKYVPLKVLTEMTMADFQKSPDVKELYSQSAGMAHFLMNPEQRDRGEAMIRYLRAVYAARGKFEPFVKALETTADEFDHGYGAWLQPGASSVEQFMLHPQMLDGLSLPHTVFQETTMAALGQCAQLTWLDLTGAVFESGQLSYLESCRRLERLYLRGCHLGPDATRSIGQLVGLRELDLSETNLGDDGLEQLGRLVRLEVLDVSGTKITAQGLEAIQKLLPNVRLVGPR